MFMPLSILLTAAATTSSLIYFLSPRVPAYQVTNIKLKDFSLTFNWFNNNNTTTTNNNNNKSSSLWWFELSGTLQAGLLIENENFLSTDVYRSTVADLFYKVNYETLQHIGEIRLSTTHTTTQQQQQQHLSEIFVDDAGHQTRPVTNFLKFSPLKLHARSSTYFHDNTVYFKNVSPWSLLTKLLVNGNIEVISSVNAHVKTANALSMTLNVLCDNKLALVFFQPKIIDRKCDIQNISSGWSSLNDVREKVNKMVVQRYQIQGTVLV